MFLKFSQELQGRVGVLGKEDLETGLSAWSRQLLQTLRRRVFSCEQAT